MDNMELSQDRARNVLGYIRTQPCFEDLDKTKKALLQYWLTANGLSYGRTVDSTNALTINSRKAVDNDKSRRVEFRIVTTSDSVIQKVIDKLK